MSFACHSYDACRPFVTLEVRNLIDDVGILQCQRDSGGQEAAIGTAGTFREEALDCDLYLRVPRAQRGLRYTKRAGWGGLRGSGKAHHVYVWPSYDVVSKLQNSEGLACTSKN